MNQYGVVAMVLMVPIVTTKVLMRATDFAMSYSTAEYVAPVWARSIPSQKPEPVY